MNPKHLEVSSCAANHNTNELSNVQNYDMYLVELHATI
jgi:hypothetical protein